MSLIQAIQKAADGANRMDNDIKQRKNDDVCLIGLLPNIALEIRFVAFNILYQSIRYAVCHNTKRDNVVDLSFAESNAHISDCSSTEPSSDRLQFRKKSLWLRSATQLGLYSTALEQCLFVFFGDSLDLYQKKVTQLTYNLRANGVYLIQTYRPDQIVLLDDNLLAKGTFVEQKQMEYVEQVEKCRKALHIEGFFKEFESSVAMATCPKCKNRDLTYVAVNTRSADEGQTVYFNCRNDKCKYKWSIRT